MAGRHAIVGLGNPGRRYEGTRHNVGFEVVDALAEDLSAPFDREAHGALWARVASEALGEVFLVKPQTFMNNSGVAVAAAARALALQPNDVVVIHDELDLPLGAVRLKLGGGDAGHRGIRSISAELDSRETVRLRLGIGRPPEDFEGEIPDFVLEAFALSEQTEVNRLLERAGEVFALLVTRGLSDAMNIANQRR